MPEEQYSEGETVAIVVGSFILVGLFGVFVYKCFIEVDEEDEDLPPGTFPVRGEEVSF